MTRYRILVVDDEIGSSRLLKANLELTKLYEVRVENRPENALAVARRFKPQLVLLDVVMPHLSGMNIAELLLADEELKSVPIIFLTAAHDSLLPQGHDPIVDRLPRIAKPACMEEILKYLELNLAPPPCPGLTVPAGPARLPGGNDG